MLKIKRNSEEALHVKYHSKEKDITPRRSVCFKTLEQTVR